ncbi:MAG TPA: 50S ribosomal protein L10, partial [Candidatus Saccharimonadales bacterium]|nr:50S ribosomal protein L10 [Candidatus Saccharimonadales bacterium]
MAVTRAVKEETVATLQADLAQLQLAVLTDYRGLSVAELTELRSNLRAEGISYRVTKNTLLRLAAAGSERFKQIDPASFAGPMALAISVT